MKIIVIICAFIAAVVSLEKEFYDAAFDNFDIRPLIEHPRTLRHYGNCFLDKGPCSPEGAEFKKLIPEVMKTVCSKCSPKQLELIRIVVRAFQTKQPDIWKELVQKMDPQGEYIKAFKKFWSESD